jgi:HEPN domain-containing protein/predicted nucleotidyltransferase
MTNDEKYNYWLTHAQYDLDTAEAMFSSSRWFYVVFMCQQALEKLVKGLYTVYVDDNVPKAHSIKTVFERFEDKLTVQVHQEVRHFFDVLSGYYLGSRYPDFMTDLTTTVTKRRCRAHSSKSKGGFPMAPNIETITALAKKYANDVKNSMPVKKAVLFGSCAKGTAHDLSDIDICFFFDSFNGKRRIEIITELLGMAGKYKGVFFEPIAFPVSEIQRGNSFVREILATGTEL